MREMLVGWRFAWGGFLAALVSACVSTEKPVELPPEPVATQPEVLFEWNPEGLFGELSIIIDLRSQIAEIYIGGQRAGWSVVATGKEALRAAPAGEYTILEKVVDKYSTLYGKTVDADGSDSES